MLDTYNLKNNPFYDTSDHELVGNNRKIQLKKIREKIQNAVEAKAPYIIIIKGTVGIGKSFGLEHLQKQTEDPKNFNGKKLMCVKFDASFGIGQAKYVQYICNSIFNSIGKAKLSEFKKDLEKIAGERDTSISDLLNKVTSDFKNAILNLDNELDLVYSWFVGEKANLSLLKKIGINNKIESTQYCLKIINDLCRLLNLLKYDGLILEIDEAEEIALSGKTKSIQILANLKQIYEENKNRVSSEEKDEFLGIIFVLGFTPETWDLLTGDYIEQEKSKTGGAGLDTFLSRVGPEFELESFTVSDTEQFIGVVLDKARDKPNKKIDPFTKDAIEYIHSVSSGIPRTIIRFCNAILDAGNTNKEKVLNKEKSAQFLVESGEIPQAEADEYVEDVV